MAHPGNPNTDSIFSLKVLSISRTDYLHIKVQNCMVRAGVAWHGVDGAIWEQVCNRGHQLPWAPRTRRAATVHCEDVVSVLSV